MSPRVEERELEIHTVVFHPPPSDSWLSAARHRDLRVSMAACMADAVGLMGGGGLMVFPAGFLRAPSMDSCEDLAGTMLELSKSAEVAMLFGIDVCSDDAWAPVADRPQSFAYACETGRTLLWPARNRGVGGRASEDTAPERCIEIGGLRLGVVVGSEVFNASIRKELLRRRPEVIVCLTHLGPTERWQTALDGLSGIAPTLLVGESASGKVPEWTRAPPGWVCTDQGGTPTMTLNCYRPEPCRAAVAPALASGRRP